MTFSYVLATHVLTVTTSRAGPVPNLDQQKAHWLERGILAWDLPAEASGWSFRLHAAPTGGLAVDEEAILGGVSFPMTLEPDGLSADLREQWPHLAAYDALRLSRNAVRQVSDLLTGQLAVAAYDDLGRLVDATGVQIPGVLDDVYGDAYDRDLGVTWQGSTPKLALWAPTAKDVDLLVRGVGAGDGHASRDASGRRRCLVGVRSTRLERCQLSVRGRRLRACRGRGRHEHCHRSVLAGADDGLGPVGDRRPRRPVVAPVRLELAAQAESRPTRGLDDLRAPRA